MDFLPIGKNSDNEFDDACVFTDVGRRWLLEGNLHSDANDVFYLLYLYPIERIPL